MQPSLTTQVLGLLLEKIGRDVPFKESRAFLLGSSPHRVATLLPLVVSGGSRGTRLPTPQGGPGPRRHLAAARGSRAACAASARKACQVSAPKGAHFTFYPVEKNKPRLATF